MDVRCDDHPRLMDHKVLGPVSPLQLHHLGLPGEGPEGGLLPPPGQGHDDARHQAIGGVHPLLHILDGPRQRDGRDVAVLQGEVELPGLGPGLDAEVAHRHGVWVSGLLLPLPRLIQIRPAAKAQIVSLAVVVLRELRHRHVSPVGRRLGPAVGGLSRRQHQEGRQHQAHAVPGPEGLGDVGHLHIPGLGLVIPAPPDRAVPLDQGPDGNLKALAVPHHQKIPGQPLSIGHVLPIRACQAHPQQGLARRGAPQPQEQRLHKG